MIEDRKKSLTDRDYSLDFLQFIGFICIVLAHVSPPDIVFELRTFDVVLLVFVSGISYHMSCGDVKYEFNDYIRYVKKRFLRLVVPTWMFLIAFFVFFYVMKMLGVEDASFSIKTYILSFTFISGIGFVWIIRVYFMMALIAPVLKGMIERMGMWCYLIGSAVVLCVYQFIVMNFWVAEGIISKLMEAYPLSLIGYGIIYGIGIIVDKYKDTTYVLTGIVGILALLSVCFNGFGSIQAAKYPPQIYYLSYGLFISLVLYIAARKWNPSHCFITWVSRESLTIYFWHVFVLKVMEVMGYRMLGIDWVVRWIAVLVSSMGFAYFQRRIQKILRNRIT